METHPHEKKLRNTIFEMISADVALNYALLKRNSSLSSILRDADFIEFAMKTDKILGLYILAAVTCNEDCNQICNDLGTKLNSDVNNDHICWVSSKDGVSRFLGT